MFSHMAAICENEYGYFFNLDHVNGIGIGHKTINGIDTGIPCLKVFVTQKLPPSNLHPTQVIPQRYKGFLTDVIESGDIIPHANTTKVRPAPGGVSIGPAGSATAGTLGCLVSTASGTALTTFVLSNNHVMAGNNTLPIGTLILQPAQGEGGANPGDGIATLSSFVTINFSGGNNLVDAAIAQVSNLSLVTNQIIDIGNITGIASAIVGTPVQKSGRTTGYTTGTIQSINTTLTVNYGGGNTAIFIRQIVTTPMSSPGDSGSIVLDMSNRVIGLLFSGSSTITGINDIRDVLKSFRARLV